MEPENSAQIIWEAKMKEQMCSLHSHDAIFDAVITKETKLDMPYVVAYSAHLIVYEVPTLSAWEPVVSIQRKRSVAQSLDALLERLREKPSAVIKFK
ncbi:hypothetical protein EJ02DRAFT_420360 [Clathrospora elynae]|uniref:Uncharacterized protein n=1 Tax=Clathrospora elynae TaxID=706981 RepID=A0A6A5T1I2_9PLEO|nr:hypothetical protein EJ02DRAFT_420360 [Clathrospora elynae]